MALGVCESLWLSFILKYLGYPPQQPIQLYCDNKTACDIVHNPVQHDRTKHVEIDRHFIREKIDEGTINLKYIPSGEQTADILTKGLAKAKFDYFIGKLDMMDIYDPT